MSEFLGNLTFGAIGYALGKHNEKQKTTTEDCVKLEDYIDEFARKHEIYYHDNRFAEELIRIAEKYKE